MKENKLNWNAHEFKVYLLLYAADADFELKEEEKKSILLSATKNEYEHIHRIFIKDTDIERIETVLSFRKQFFPTEKDVTKMIKEIYKLLTIDEKFSLNEENFFRIFNKILKI